MADVARFRHAVRAALVRFYPELEHRRLLRPVDAFDLRIAGTSLVDDTFQFRQLVTNFENAGSPLYVEIVPRNIPPALPPLSARVKRVENAARIASLDSGLQLCMISFYKFVRVEQPELAVSLLTKVWSRIGVKGRVYVAREGVNAQLAVPHPMLADFQDIMSGVWTERDQPLIPRELLGVFLNVDRVVHHKEQPFEKLNVRVRDKVLADGLDQPLDWTASGREVDPTEWHRLLKDKDKDVVLLDCRNDYESDVGRFEGAESLNTSTFRDTWDKLEKRLSTTARDTKILTYCTGGIRCVKVNAFLEQKMGFKDTGRLGGGIVSYARMLREEDALQQSMFKGVNHVFDGRMGEVITPDLLDRCRNCSAPCNVQTDCANLHCARPFDKRIFVQCAECTTRMLGACCDACRALVAGAGGGVTGVLPEGDVTGGAKKGGERTDSLDERFADAFSDAEDPLLVEVRERTVEMFPSRARMMSSHAQALFLKMMVQMSGAKRVLEIGTFTGYAALSMAYGMTDGEVVTCELDDEVADVAEAFFKRRKDHCAHITLLRGRALDSMKQYVGDGGVGRTFDMAFVDADKGGYVDYVRYLLDSDVLKIGGVLVADNVLFRGEVSRLWMQAVDDENAVVRKRLGNVQNVRKIVRSLLLFNEFVKEEPRLDQVILPFRDGLMIARRVQ